MQRRAERVEVVDAPREPWALHMNLAPRDRGGEQIASLASAVIRRGTFELGPIDLDVARGDRIALLGPNGSGKSTLLAAVLGEIPLATGSRAVGPATVLGALRQERVEFLTTLPLLDAFAAVTGVQGAEARSLLAKFDLGADDVERPGAELSAGERTRASLAVLMAGHVNCLVLDEPTNHLDIPAIEELERSLAAYRGTFLLATHDRRLLERVGITREMRFG
jgi:ATPase subunit of ABC transporter with duplicated ATPase domains